MSARLAITARPSLGSGRLLLLSVAASRPIARTPPSLVKTDPRRHVHPYSRLEPPQRPVHAQQEHHNQGRQSSSGRRLFRVLVGLSSVVGAAVILGAIGLHFTGAQFYMGEAKILFPNERDDDWWRAQQKLLKDQELLAGEPYRTFYQQAHDAIGKKDFLAARSALEKAWRATEGMTECRLLVFHPSLIAILETLYQPQAGEGTRSTDMTRSARFLEEVLPIMEQARLLPPESRPDNSSHWHSIWFLQLPMCVTLAKWHVDGLLGQSQDYVRARAALEHGREICIAFMEGKLDALQVNNVAEAAEAKRVALMCLGEYCQSMSHSSMATSRSQDAVQFARYHALIAMSGGGTATTACESANNMTASILFHLRETLLPNRRPVVFSKEDVSPDFANIQGVLTMPLEKLLKANVHELLVATQTSSALAAVLLTNTVHDAADRHRLEVDHFTLSAAIALATNKREKCFDFVQKAEKAARDFAARTGQRDLIRDVAQVRANVEMQFAKRAGNGIQVDIPWWRPRQIPMAARIPQTPAMSKTPSPGTPDNSGPSLS